MNRLSSLDQPVAPAVNYNFRFCLIIIIIRQHYNYNYFFKHTETVVGSYHHKLSWHLCRCLIRVWNLFFTGRYFYSFFSFLLLSCVQPPPPPTTCSWRIQLGIPHCVLTSDSPVFQIICRLSSWVWSLQIIRSLSLSHLRSHMHQLLHRTYRGSVDFSVCLTAAL